MRHFPHILPSPPFLTLFLGLFTNDLLFLLQNNFVWIFLVFLFPCSSLPHATLPSHPSLASFLHLLTQILLPLLIIPSPPTSLPLPVLLSSSYYTFLHLLKLMFLLLLPKFHMFLAYIVISLLLIRFPYHFPSFHLSLISLLHLLYSPVPWLSYANPPFHSFLVTTFYPSLSLLPHLPSSLLYLLPLMLLLITLLQTFVLLIGTTFIFLPFSYFSLPYPPFRVTSPSSPYITFPLLVPNKASSHNTYYKRFNFLSQPHILSFLSYSSLPHPPFRDTFPSSPYPTFLRLLPLPAPANAPSLITGECQAPGDSRQVNGASAGESR